VPGRWTIVALGDSVVSGPRCGCAPFVDRYAALVTRRTGHPTRVRNLGVGGSTSAELRAALQPGGAEATQLAGADIVTVTIGANDMGSARAAWRERPCAACVDGVAATVATNLGAILRRVRVDAGRRPLEILVTTYWNVFEEATDPGSDDPDTADYVRMADLATSRANAAICAAAAEEKAACIDLYRPFKGDRSQDASSLLADDLDHPSAEGHQLIASTLADYGWRELGMPPRAP
jgi:lysophospholipase L1-like esterase